MIWHSMWPKLLSAAAVAAAGRRGDDELTQAGTSIVLSRASWESFANEFIEMRQLPSAWKRLTQPKLVDSLKAWFESEGFSKHTGDEWDRLTVLNRLRNALVHHDAT